MISCLILFEKMFQTKVQEKINTFSFNTYLRHYPDVYVTMWKNVVQPNRPQTDNAAHPLC